MKKMMVAAATCCLLAGGWSGDVQSTVPQGHGENAKEAEFDFYPEQFVHAFNGAAKSFGQSYRLHKAEVKHGSVHDYFQHTFSNGVSLTAGVSKDTGRIVSVTALVENDSKSIDHNQRLLAIAEVVVAATNPRLTREKTSALTADMLKEAGGNQEAGQFPQRFINHVRYVLRKGSGIGYWWIASPV